MRLIPLLFLLGTLAASAQESMIRQVPDGDTTDTHVEVTSLFSSPAADGYFPVRVKVANNRKTPAIVRVKFKASSGWGDDLASHSNFDFTAAPETTVIRDVLVPQQPVGSSFGGAVAISTEMSGTLGSATHHASVNYEPTQASVLMSEPLFTKNALKLDTALSAKIASGRYGGSTKFASRFTAADLPDNWLAYSGFDYVLMLDRDWTAAPAGARAAILSWIRLGGNLIVHTTGGATAASLSIPDNAGYGTIRFVSIPSSLDLNEDETILRVEGTASSNRKFAFENDYHSGWPLRVAFGDESFRYAVFIVILVIFGILVGPINLFVFAKSGRRHRLFITTPIIALGASFLLILLIVFQDGLGGKGQRIVLMEVAENSAHIHQEQFCRTGVLMSSNFTLDPPALISPLQIPETPWARFTTSSQRGTFTVQPAGAKIEASGDWFQSRSEQGHAIETVAPTRGRIEAASGNKLVSTFGFPIRKLFFLDATGTWHRAENIATGQPFDLVRVDAGMADPEMNDLAAKLSTRNQTFFDRARKRTSCFVAVTDAAPAIDTLSGIRWQETTTLITGPVSQP